jgi:hypothetical protein
MNGLFTCPVALWKAGATVLEKEKGEALAVLPLF